MAKITIELDTAVGDTFRKVLDAFLDATPAGRDIYAEAAKDLYDPNAWKAPPSSTDVVFTERSPEEIIPVTPITKEDVASVAASFPTLTDMDGDRKRGEAAPGHRRRTNAQIKDDELWLAQKERAEAALKAMDKGVEPAIKNELRYFVHPESETLWARKGHPTGRDGLAEEIDEATYLKLAAQYKRVYIDDNLQPVISTGEERINPEDAADEAAETAARPAGAPTLEDLRAVVALYIDKFGHVASVKNMKTIIGCAVAECPVDEIPNAIAKVRLALDGSVTITPVNPATGRPSAEPETAELFGDKPAAPVTATKADVVAALMAYAAKFDGSQDPEKMPITKEDMPKVFAATFGAGVSGMGSMPDQKPETLGRILTAIQAATSANTFGRTAK